MEQKAVLRIDSHTEKLTDMRYGLVSVYPILISDNGSSPCHS